MHVFSKTFGALTVAVGALVMACGSGSEGIVDPVTDSGPGSEPDAGPSDAGEVCNRDGICDDGETRSNCPTDCLPNPCPDGTEGCECNASFAPGDMVFNQDDCESGTLCVPWDTLSGRNDLTGPLQSCVRPCVSDDDCGTLADGTQRHCVDDFGFPQSSGIGRVCVDRRAQVDQYCGTSKLTTQRAPGTTVQTPNELVGCGEREQCTFGVINALHPDEGVCLEFCGRPGDPACSGETPYCNPNLLTDTATDGTTINFGVCSVAQLGIGSWCRPTLDDSPALTQICDSSGQVSGNVICVGVGLTYGLCIERCDTTMADVCENTDPTQGAQYCVDNLLMNGGGLCMTPDCSNTPDTCDGDGALGNGRFCRQFTADGDGVCVDRRAPVLAVSTVDSAGALRTEADDCTAEDMGLAQCPENSFCVGTPNGGVCAVGCDRTAPNDFCEGALDALGLPSSTSTCTAALGDTPNGLCGGD